MTQNTMGIRDISRSAHVTRWHSVGVHRNQSVAEHSALAAFYTEYILLAVNPHVSVNDHLTALRYSLWHDQPEVVTGDLCTPIKRLLETYFQNDSPLENIEKHICPQYRELSEMIEDNYLKSVTKLADYLEAIVFLEEEGKEKQAEKIKQDIIQNYKNLIQASLEKYPEYQWDKAHGLLTDVLNDDPLQIDNISSDFLLSNL